MMIVFIGHSETIFDQFEQNCKFSINQPLHKSYLGITLWHVIYPPSCHRFWIEEGEYPKKMMKKNIEGFCFDPKRIGGYLAWHVVMPRVKIGIPHVSKRKKYKKIILPKWIWIHHNGEDNPPSPFIMQSLSKHLHAYIDTIPRRSVCKM